MTPLHFSPADGVTLHGYRWEPATALESNAVIHIVHGMAEHAGRYAGLADAMIQVGYAVYACDLRGHGHSAAGRDDLGFFAPNNGWRACLDDLGLIHSHIAKENPGKPIFMLGHSMGSFLTQQFITEHGDALAGVILSSSDGRSSVAGRMVARLERLRLGPRGRSELMRRLVFGEFNRPFRPARTPFDWLSRDPAEVDRYMEDLFCGFIPTTQMWIDLLDALGDLWRPERLARIPKTLPLYIMAGDHDPVSANTKGLERLMDAYRRVGLEKVTHRFYPGARHELFHETNRDDVTRDLIAWCDAVVNAA